MTEQLSYLIIGNGIAGATAAEILRDEDAAADITVIADDPFPVYYRPALKDYLGGKLREDKLWARPISFYQDRHVRFLTGRVVGIQVGQHTVVLSSGQTVGYSRLLLAHGARASTLTCPGVDLAGVSTLRTVADYQKVLSRLNNVHRVVVTGSGTLALESIETLRHRGFQVTHLLRRRSLWSEVLDPIASDLVLQQEKRDGVDVRYEQEIAEIVGKDGQVTAIITTTGVQIPCEMVLLGIGIDPIIDFVKSAGIACGRGVKVDGAMRTNVPDIYAAGDLIETTDPITGRSRVIGQWYPSIQQARAAAYSMLELLDAKHQFRFGNFYNATFLYGLDFASVGLSTIPKDGKGYQEIVADPQPRTYKKVILKDGVPVGMLALGDRKSVLTFKRAVDHSVNLSPISSRLFAPDFNLTTWLDKQAVPAAILGTSREGAAAVKQAAYAGSGAGTLSGGRSNTPSPQLQLKLQVLTEAILVPVAPPEIKSSLGETYLSQTKVATVGRQEGAVLSINHNSMSRRHAEISYANGQYVLRDLESKNGTFVNDERLEPGSVRILKPDDQVRFGKVTFALHVRETDASSSMLLRPQTVGAPLHLPSPGVNVSSQRSEKGTIAAPAGNGNLDLPHNDAAGKTIVGAQFIAPNNTPEGKMGGIHHASLPSREPVLNSDGSLLLPAATSAVSAAIVATMKDTPALVAIVHGKPEVFLLKQGKRFILGRDKGSDIALSDMSISRKHAEVFPGPDGFYIRDLASSNGVQVNQTRINNPYHLSHTDRITVGNITMYYLDLSGKLPLTRGTTTHQTDPGDKHVEAPLAHPVWGTGNDRPTTSTAASMAEASPKLRQTTDIPPSKICNSCGSRTSNVARFCASCGAPL